MNTIAINEAVTAALAQAPIDDEPESVLEKCAVADARIDLEKQTPLSAAELRRVLKD